MNNQILTNKVINNIDTEIKKMLEVYQEGEMNKSDFVSIIGHLVSAIDKRNEVEVDSFCKGIFREK